jgi:hypothetical protein
MALCHFNQFLDTQFPASLFALLSSVRAKGTVVYTNICWFEMDVAIEKYLPAIDPVTDKIRKNGQK